MLEQLYSEAKEKQSLSNYCTVGQWAMTLSESDKTVFDKSLGDVDFSTRSLMRLYANAGAVFGLTSLQSHRNGDCSCL